MAVTLLFINGLTLYLYTSYFRSGPSCITKSNWSCHMPDFDLEGQIIESSLIIAIFGCYLVINQWIIFIIGQKTFGIKPS
jgi:hypothetical protein